MMDIFITLMVEIVPCVYAYVQISQNVYIKYVVFFLYIKYNTIKLRKVKQCAKRGVAERLTLVWFRKSHLIFVTSF